MTIHRAVYFSGWMLCASLVACSGSRSGESTASSDSDVDLETIDPSIPLREQLLRIPGVYLNQEGEIRIRGASGPPLYVVDGAPMVGDNLSFLNLNDVASVKVLKGPEAAIYGSRGGRGVVLINTKRPPER